MQKQPRRVAAAVLFDRLRWCGRWLARNGALPAHFRCASRGGFSTSALSLIDLTSFASIAFVRLAAARSGKVNWFILTCRHYRPSDFGTPADSKFPIVDCLFHYRSPPTVVVGIRLGRRVEPWGFGRCRRSSVYRRNRGLTGGGVTLAGGNDPGISPGLRPGPGNTLACRFVRYAGACPATARPSPTLRAAQQTIVAPTD